MSAAARGRILVIGLELGDGRLVREWAAAGHLPSLATLIDAGTWGWLETTAEQLHVSAWPSIYTGVGPGEHGVYYTFQPAPGLQGYRRFHEGLYGRPTFWRLLDAAGRRCAVLDAPYTHPEPGFTGIQVFDWGTWAHYLEPQSTPGMNVGYWGPQIKVGEPQPALNVNMDAHTNCESLSFTFDNQLREMPTVVVYNELTKLSFPIPIPNITPLSPPTWAGVLPMPIVPRSLPPQTQTTPSPVSARLCSPPPAMAVTPVNPSTWIGTCRSVAVPSPSWPW